METVYHFKNYFMKKTQSLRGSYPQFRPRSNSKPKPQTEINTKEYNFAAGTLIEENKKIKVIFSITAQDENEFSQCEDSQKSKEQKSFLVTISAQNNGEIPNGSYFFFISSKKIKIRNCDKIKKNIININAEGIPFIKKTIKLELP